MTASRSCALNLGAPLPPQFLRELERAAGDADAARVQQILDSRALFVVQIDAESRVSVARGRATAILQQAGYTPLLIKVINPAASTAPLRISSPQGGLVFAGMTQMAADRQQQPHLRENENTEHRLGRFLDLEMFTAAPMAPNLTAKCRLTGASTRSNLRFRSNAAAGSRYANFPSFTRTRST